MPRPCSNLCHPDTHASFKDADAQAQSLGGAGLCQLARQSVTAWSNDYPWSNGRGVAYYALFSLAPLMLLVKTGC
jgi:uncharacterized BrkB/YihY/UPF0761 family membrane protein